MNLNDGYKKAGVRGTSSRNTIKETAPKLFRRTMIGITIVTLVLWLINKLSPLIEVVKTSKASKEDEVSEKSLGFESFIENLGLDTTIISNNPWWTALAIVVVVSILILLFRKGGDKKPANSLASLTMAVVAIGSMLLVLQLTGTLDAVSRNGDIALGVTCSKPSDFHRFTISDTVGTELVLCSGRKPVTMTPAKGMCLQARVSPAFETQYGHLLEGTGSDRWKKFAELQLPKTYPGSTAQHWRFVPNNKSFVSRQSFKYIILNVRSQSCT